MKKTIKTIAVLLLMTVGQISFGQSTNEEKAYSKGMEAIKLMDNGEIDKSIKLLEEAKKLDPQNIDYPYEIAYAQYLNKDYKASAKTLETLTKHSNVNDRIYQLLGNSYSMNGQPKKAIETYENGLNKFPNSGKLYLERGNMEMFVKEYVKALSFFEKGIEVDPKFPSNYFWATKIYCSSTEEVWGMIYGEIFMNLERNSKRTVEISKLLFDTYKSEIKFTSDSSFSVSFSKNASINISDLADPSKMRLPFGISVYEPTLMFSMLSAKAIDISSLDDIRSTFIDNYFKNGHDKKYPNVLFSYQKQVKEAGHIEAYNHWILMKGDEDGFDKWFNENKEKWDSFVKWFSDNGLQINDTNKFYSGQY
jgi:tetratricopeptide (TPR) repeat protein